MSLHYNNMEQTYKSAVALNNYGITLLKRHCFEQGLATLRDAMDTIRSLSYACETSTECQVNVQQYLQDCFLRLANPISSCCSRKFLIHAIACNVNDHEKALSTDSVQQIVVSPIRVDDLSFDASKLDDGFEETVSIVLHNFAIANWCASKCSPHSVPPSKPLNLLRLSNEILDRLAKRCKDELQLRKIACVNIVVIWSLLQVLILETNLTSISSKEECGTVLAPYYEFIARLRYLQTMVQWIDQTFSYWTQPPTLAPAA